MREEERRSSGADASGPVILRPLVDFLHTEAAGGVVLMAATVVALAWANSPFKESYYDLWHTHLSISLGTHSLDLDLQEWVNDGLMAIFFFVVGLEIKRELVEGELREPRRAAMPAIAAVGGMLVPALIYFAINAGGDGAQGWGIPMATDIAMAVGVLSLVGSRVAPSLKLFLLALAIVDDIGAILVIAVFYSEDIDFRALAVAVALGGRRGRDSPSRRPVHRGVCRARCRLLAGPPRVGAARHVGGCRAGTDGAHAADSTAGRRPMS